MSIWRRISGRLSTLAVLLDVVALAVYFYFIPILKRPWDGLLIIVMVLGAVTAFCLKQAWVKNVCVLVISLSAMLFALEMGEKYFGFLERIVHRTHPVVGAGGKYAFISQDSGSYLESRARAVADGLVPEALEGRLAGDVFTPEERKRLTAVTDVNPAGMGTLWEYLKPLFVVSPLGYESTPDNKFRAYVYDDPSKTVLFDCVAEIDGAGIRKTRDNPESDDVYVFFGCSFTFGFGLNDDETAAYFFSEAEGFAGRVLNLGVSGYGPPQSLRELELNRHMGRAGVDPGKVRKVFYGLFDAHTMRLLPSYKAPGPYYVLRDGRAVYRGLLGDVSSFSSRLPLLLRSSRILPALLDRVEEKWGTPFESHDWRLMLAILNEMHGICRERYGVPLTVIYWDDTPEVMEKLRAMGMEVVRLADALGKDWQKEAIRYVLPDGHPNVVANRLLGQHLHALAAQGNPGQAMAAVNNF